MPYCQHCGKKLEDGEICTCETAQAAANQAPQPEQPPIQQDQAQQTEAQAAPRTESQVSVIFKKLKLYLSSYISNPAQAIRSAMEDKNDFTLPVVLTAIRLLAMGLALYGLLRKICDNAFTAITTAAVRYGSASNLLTASLTASLFQCLIWGILISVIMMFLIILFMFIIVKIRHGEVTFMDIFRANALNGVLPSALLLLAFLFSFGSATACIVLTALSVLAGIICGVLTLHLVCPDSSSGAVWLMYFVGIALVIFAGSYLVPVMFLRAMGGITASYMGETVTLQSFFDQTSQSINSAMKEANVSNIWALFRKGIEEVLDELSYEFWRSVY